MLCTVDAYVNSDLKSYLLGSYPTVRVFTKGKASNKSFIGSKNPSFVASFIDQVIEESKNNSEDNEQVSAKERSNLLEIQSTQQFEEIVATSNVPVVVKFSAYW